MLIVKLLRQRHFKSGKRPKIPTNNWFPINAVFGSSRIGRVALGFNGCLQLLHTHNLSLSNPNLSLGIHLFLARSIFQSRISHRSVTVQQTNCWTVRRDDRESGRLEESGIAQGFHGIHDSIGVPSRSRLERRSACGDFVGSQDIETISRQCTNTARTEQDHL